MIQKLDKLDKKYTGKLAQFEGGLLLNCFSYLSSAVFMEEMIIGTLAGLHFYFGQDWNISKCYLITFGTNVVMTYFSKKFFDRKRPDPQALNETSKTKYFRNKQSYNASFPSGDTIQAWALVVFCYFFLPSWKFYYVAPLAFLVPVSRIYLGCHYFGDCIGGALFGTLTTLGTIYALNNPSIQNFFKYDLSNL